MNKVLQDNMSFVVVAVAVPRPLFTFYHYRHIRPLPVGVRVRIRLGNKSEIGVVVDGNAYPVPELNLKPVEAVLDDEPLFDDKLLAFLKYIARYYQHPLGEILATALPNALVKGGENIRHLPRFVSRTELGKTALFGTLGGKQKAVLSALEIPYAEEDLRTQFSISRAWLADLCARGWIQIDARFVAPIHTVKTAPVLSTQQTQVLKKLSERQAFGVDVLDGVTGSGKTEVYIRRVEQLLATGGQVLLLAPEIALAEMLYSRLAQRLSVPIALHHSGMTDSARLSSWQAVKVGDARVLIGTRSALFSSFKQLSGIIVDECHDQAYKQQDTFRYHARDMAVVRAKLADVPLLLGSATLSLETWRQVELGNWRLLQLTSRVIAEKPARVTIDDIEDKSLIGGMSTKLISEIHRRLVDGEQVMLFLNRRGYAPVLRCGACGYQSACDACDAMMTAHTSSQRLQCHHCGRCKLLPNQCPDCGSTELILLGLGTQRLEQGVRQQFPQARVLRIDSDAFTTAKQFQQAIEQVQRGEVDIILGTQWLSKGHHFPNVQLVAVIDADSAFYSGDFRAEERLAQLLLQVGGRAGREREGHIWIQTAQSHHPIFQQIFREPYQRTAHRLNAQRQSANLPPYSAQVLLYARHKQAERAMEVLRFTREGAQSAGIGKDWLWLGPAPALMARKDGQHRAQLLVQAPNRQLLQKELPILNQWLLAQGKAFSVRVGMDVDPLWTD